MKKACKVALADGHDLMRECLVELLTHWGYQVVLTATTNNGLIDQIKAGVRPDICILEIKMPLTSQLESCRIIKEICPHIKVVALIMNASKNVAEKLRNAADAVICKSDSILEVKSALAQIENRSDNKLSNV